VLCAGDRDARLHTSVRKNSGPISPLLHHPSFKMNGVERFSRTLALQKLTSRPDHPSYCPEVKLFLSPGADAARKSETHVRPKVKNAGPRKSGIRRILLLLLHVFYRSRLMPPPLALSVLADLPSCGITEVRDQAGRSVTLSM